MIKTQGTKLFFIDPDASGGPEVVALDCATGIDGAGAPREQIEVTCLEDAARNYVSGLTTPDQMTVNLNFDPSVPSHYRVYQLYKAGTKIEMAIGLSDGTAIPTVDSDDLFELPTTRTFVVLHEAYFSNVPLSFALNAVVTAAVTVQLSDTPEIVAKA